MKIDFLDKNLMTQAFIHRSYLNEAADKSLSSNERLEFLGDSILSFVISEWLFEKFPNYPEGGLTDLRSNLVNTNSLAEIAHKFGLGDCLFLSKGERDSGGRKNPVLLANCLEAIIGAVFLDQGLEKVKKFIHANFKATLERITKSGLLKDYKSILQERVQAKTRLSPVYKTIKEEGPDHAKIFTVGVYSQNELLALGQGKSKQVAEEEAAKAALEKISSKR